MRLSLLWLWRHFPKTVLGNMQALQHHGCLKGLLDLLMYAAWDHERYVETDLEDFPRRGTVDRQRREWKSQRVLRRRAMKSSLGLGVHVHILKVILVCSINKSS